MSVDETVGRRDAQSVRRVAHDDVADGRPARRSGFRGDVQGLRAIAVLTVIVGHAGLGPFPGGYVGVDVFFVISGYLIAGLLYREVERHGHVSLAGFYARRARRILPAASVVIVGTLVAATLWMSLIDAAQAVRDAVWASLFAANIRFATVGTDYFAQDELPSPLQHFWSLAVEEQFYLVWPLLLLGVVLWKGRRRGRHLAERDLPRTAIGWTLGAVTVVSFGYSVVHTFTEPTWAYFSTFTRAWELGLGALLALVPAALTGLLTDRARVLLGVGGVAAILLACLRFDEHTPMPGYAALLPVLGSGAVLMAGAGVAGAGPWSVRWLAVRPMRVVGDWSYSLYLWHWPILTVWAGHQGRDLTTGQALVAVALTFVLSWLTYRFVETPFRTARLSVPRAVTLYPASVAVVVLVALSAHVVVTGQRGDNPPVTVDSFGVPDRSKFTLSEDETVALVQASVIAARHHMAVPSRTRPDLLTVRNQAIDLGQCDYTANVRKLCPRGDPEGERSLVLIGDSHARHWIPAFDKIAADAGWRAYFLVKPNCNPLDRIVSDPVTGDEFTACTEFKQWTAEQVHALQPDVAVVSSTPPTALWIEGERVDDFRTMADLSVDGYESLFRRLGADSDRVVFMPDIAKGTSDPPACLTTGDPDLGTCMFRSNFRAEHFRKASIRAAETAGVEIIDPMPWVCWRGMCPVVIGDLLPYRDRGHLTEEYARHLADPLGQALGLDR